MPWFIHLFVGGHRACFPMFGCNDAYEHLYAGLCRAILQMGFLDRFGFVISYLISKRDIILPSNNTW